MEQATGPDTMRIGAEWPAPAPKQVEVMLLGTYHMDGGVDDIDPDIDDVLSEQRQRELRRLADVLADWEPDLVAVERPHERADCVNALYDDYRTGERAYDEVSEIDPPHPARSELDTECRSEVVQVGFRLADRMGHDGVAPVDYTIYDIYERDYDDEYKQAVEEMEAKLDGGGEVPRKVDVADPSDGYSDALYEHLQDSAIPEHLVELNREPNVRSEPYHQFGQHLGMVHDGVLVGPRAIAGWYDRNIRMCHYLWREMDDSKERVCYVVGAGHVSTLRHLLTEAPQFCPVSPLPYLREAATD